MTVESISVSLLIGVTRRRGFAGSHHGLPAAPADSQARVNRAGRVRWSTIPTSSTDRWLTLVARHNKHWEVNLYGKDSATIHARSSSARPGGAWRTKRFRRRLVSG